MTAEKIKLVEKRIIDAEKRFLRIERSVHLLAVSKKYTINQIKAAYNAGLTRFGESYIQEAEPKIAELTGTGIEWHFIGPIQSNKTKTIAEKFDWVHSVGRLKIAQRLNDQRPTNLGPLNICLQVNVSNEPSKSGVALDQLPTMVKSISQYSNLRLRGLMAIPKPEMEFEKQRLPYRKLNLALQELNQQGYELDTLSMGMSTDLEAAISEGSTIVRIGRSLFGERTEL